jgi:hypothetical protein
VTSDFKEMTRHGVKWVLVECITIVSVGWVAVPLRVLEVLGSNLGSETGCPAGGYSRVSSSVLPDDAVIVSLPETRPFSLLRSTQTGFRAYPGSYTMGIGGSFPGGKAVRA